MSVMMHESDNWNKNENLYTQTSSDLEYHTKNPFIKIELIDSIKLSSSLHERDEDIRDEHLEHKEIVESMQRRFGLQLKKEKQLFTIVQSKLKQQIEFLVEQNQSLKKQNKDISNKLKQSILNSQIQSKPPEVNSPLVLSQISNLRNMLLNLQKEHENCISNKKELMDNRQTLEMRVMMFEKEIKQLQPQCKELKKKIQLLKQIQSQNLKMKNEVQLLSKQVISLKVLNQQQQKQFSKQLSSLQKAIQEINSKTLLPEFPQKIISFSNEQPVQHHNQKNRSEILNQRQRDLKNTSKFIQSKVNLECQIDRHKDGSAIFETNRFLFESFEKSSFAESNLSYSTDKNFADRQIIQGLYKKNLSFLNEEHKIEKNRGIYPISQINKGNNIQSLKPETGPGRLSNRNKHSETNFPFSARQSNSSSKVSLTNRRFRYL